MKISIITINRNNAEGLRMTMESVLQQTYRDIEYIMVDGASTDGSVEVIKDYVDKVERVNDERMKVIWVSEPDKGIYNAMNKGVRKATGEYLLMLNSGDFFVNEHVIEKIVPELDDIDIVQGNVITRSNGTEIVQRGYGKSDISYLEVMKGFFLHQASFCRRELFEKYGYFDESYRINGDTVFYAKCLAFGNASFKYVDQNIAYYDMTGISADPEGKWKKLRMEEDRRYMDMYPKRMQLMLKEDEKKILLYDRLHAHKWSWCLTMAVVRLVSLLHR